MPGMALGRVASMRSMTRRFTPEPPSPTAVRLRVSVLAKAGEPSSWATMVVDAAIAVMRSFSIRRKASSTFHLYIITMRRPVRREQRKCASRLLM